jgi:glycerophosphoryl diester phosphodiesterase/lysophospholipase L1-like esterase
MKKLFLFAGLLAVAAALGVERPWIVGHRGGRHEFDDNACGAFRQSIAYGITSFETDIRSTKDGELVIMHDGDVSRTTTGQGKVAEMTLAEFKALKLKASGEAPPSLADLVEIFAGRAPFRVEFEMKEWKPLSIEEYCDKLYKTASAKMMKGTYIFTSFKHDLVRTMRKVHPEAKTALIIGRVLDDQAIEDAIALGASGVAPLLKTGGGKGKDGKPRPVARTTKEMVAKAHSKGLAISVWMVNDGATYKEARAVDADTCTSDMPITILAASRVFDAKAADPTLNTALFPVPRLQTDSYNWFARHRRILAERPNLKPEIIFIGDSITHFWAGRDSIGDSSDPKTLPSWKEAFGAYKTLNLGYGWDRTSNVFYRLADGEMDGMDPKVVVIHIGGNNLTTTSNWQGNTPEEVVEAIAKLVETVHGKAPKAEILVMSVFPFGKKPGDWHRPKLRILNPLLAERMKAYPYVKYLDVHDKFLDENGVYRPELSRGDNVHPSVEGYKIWAAALLPEFKRIFGRF